jgi:hypothetical protein
MALVQGKGPAKESPAIYLAAFGKHPGWDDHIEDIGIETELLAQVRRMLYTDAISGNIDSGAWEKLADDQRLPGFAHDFVWWMGPTGKEPPRVIVGKFWSSRDGKGRSKYPMAVYVQANNIPLTVAAREILPALNALEKSCIEATSAQDVKAAIDRTREQLRAQFARSDAPAKVPHPIDIIPQSQIAGLLDRVPLGEKKGEIREGFARAMYAVEREMGSFLPIGGEGRKSKTLGVQPVAVKAAHIRLPSLETSSADSALAWISILSRRIADGIPILAVVPRGEGFVDLVVGEPGAAQLYCIRASAKGFPLTTDVPYVIDDAFMSRLGEMVARWSGAAPSTGERSAAPIAAPTQADSSAAPAQKKSGIRGWLFGGGAAIVLAGVGLAVMNSGEGDKSKGTTVASSAGTSSTASANPTTPSTDTGPPDAGKKAAEDEQAKLAALESKRQADLKAKQQAEQERKDKEKAELAKAETERFAREKEAAEVAATEKAAQELAAKELAAKELIAKEQAARELALKEEASRVQAAKDEAARLASAKEQAEKDAKENARIAAERKAEEDRIEQIAAAEMEKENQRKAAEEAEASNRTLELATQLELAASMLADGSQLNDQAGAGKTLAKLVEDVRSSAAFASVADSPNAKKVVQRVSIINQVAASSDVAFVARHMAEPGDGNLAVSVVSLERLAAMGWPSDAAGVEQAAQGLKHCRVVALGVSDEGRGELVRKRIDQAGRAMWLAAWKAVPADDAARQLAVVGAMKDFGVEASSLDAIERYNVELVGFKGRVASIAPLDLDAQVEKFVNDAPEQARESLEPLSVLLNERRASAASGPPIDKLGPGSLEGANAWKLAASTDAGGAWLVFEPPAGSKFKTSLVFGRVTTSLGASYVLANEVSIGLFASTIDQSGNWGDVVKLGRIEPKQQLRRVGPAGWEWELSGGQVSGLRPATLQNRTTSRGWFDFDNYMAKTQYFAQGKEPEAPSAQTPMQYVSPAAAVYVAKLLGCRLPTVEEFSSVIGQSDQGSANRRDESWLTANTALYAKTGGRNTTSLDGEMFLPSGVTAPNRAKALAAVQTNDGQVLFRAIPGDSAASAWQDAAGNVAEFVVADASIWGGVPTGVAELRDWTSKSESLRVMGGSALSPAEIDPATAYPVKGVSSLLGYSDVGFRIAFEAQGSGRMTADGSAVVSAVVGLRLQGRNN